MNMLGAATLDLIEQIRAITKGWRIEPLVYEDSSVPLCDADGHFLKAIINPPSGVSCTKFFADWMTKRHDTSCLIRIKIKNKRLRFIQCRLDGTTLPLSYWHGEGWRQNEYTTNKNRHIVIKEFDYTRYTVYKMFRICRMIKGKKNRGKKSPGHPGTIINDRVELNDPESAKRISMMAVATVLKSLGWNPKGGPSTRGLQSPVYGIRRAIVLDGDDFTFDIFHFCTFLEKYSS